MSNFLIETKNLKKNFKDFTAVDGIDIKVKKGEIYGFLGPNGAGKSTTIRMLLGLIKPTEGDINIFNKNLKKNKIDILKSTGSLVESPSYYGNLTAYENLEITRKILEVNKKEISKVLDIVNLTKWKNKRVKNFSLGMKQRLGIAQALLGNPKLLILDEPTNGLDPSGIHEIRELIKNLPSMLDITVLVSSHILSEIELIATQVGIISNGKLLYQGTLDELRSRETAKICINASPHKEVTKILLSNQCNFTKKDNLYYIEKGNLSIEDINKQLVFSGCDVSYLSIAQKSLESIFLEITGGTV